MHRRAVLSGGIRIEMVARSRWRRRGRRTLGPVPQFRVAQDLFDDRAVPDLADDFQWFRATGTNQAVSFVHSSNQPCPRTAALTRQLRAVGSVLVHPLRCSRGSGCGWCRARGTPARIGKGSVIPDELLSRSFTPGERAKLEQRGRARYGEPVDTRVTPVDHIPVPESGKRLRVISRIPPLAFR